MKNIRIELPNNFQFSTTIKVRITDINYGGHLGNDAFLSFLQEARLQYLQRLGFKSEKDGPNGLAVIIVDLAIVYKKECFYGTTLKIEISAQEISRKYCNLYYRISDLETQQEIAKAQTKMLFFDFPSKKITSISPELHEKLVANHI